MTNVQILMTKELPMTNVKTGARGMAVVILQFGLCHSFVIRI